MDTTVSVTEFRRHILKYVQYFGAGGELVVTERGRPIARVISDAQEVLEEPPEKR